MRYDIDRFEVAPGKPLALTLANPDDILHNLVLLRPRADQGQALAQRAWTLPKALEKQYVPEDDAILAATKLVQPRSEETLRLRAPEVPGDYPYVCTFPGHWMTMRGTMRVTSEERGLRKVRYAFYDGLVKRMPDFSGMKPDRTGTVAGGRLIDMAPFDGMGDFSVVFEGDLIVPHTGEYEFAQQSDGGSRVWVDGDLLIDRNRMYAGDKAAQVTAATVHLRRGTHRLRYEYYDFDKDEQVVLAWSGPGLPKTYLSRQRKIDVSEPVVLEVKDRARVDRVVLPNAPPKSLAVGLPGGTNFALHTETGRILYAWFGEYLDVAPDRVHRGGKACRALEERRAVDLRMSAELSRSVEFLGYSRADPAAPVFRYRMGDGLVEQRVEPDQKTPEALRVELRFPEGPPSVLTLSAEVPLQFADGADVTFAGNTYYLSGIAEGKLRFTVLASEPQATNDENER